MRRSRGWKISPNRSAGISPLWASLLLWLVLTATACSAAPSPEATGPQLYGDLCSACHGAGLEGKVGPALGPRSLSADLPDQYLATTIERGIGTMPSFDHLSQDQIARLVSFIRDVQSGR